MMNTREILNLLKSKQVFSFTLPEWVYMSIPIPCLWKNQKALCVYFYPTKRKSVNTVIFPPILRLIISYPDGILLERHKAPFVEGDKTAQCTPIGNYPGSILSQKTFDEVTALYEQYYKACDDIFSEKNITSWHFLYEQLHEEGLEKYINLLNIIGK